MEKDIKLLDCTLRDGGYLVDTQFGDKFIKGFIQSLTDAAVDVIEVGFLKDEPHQPGSTIFNNSAQIKPYLPKERREGVAYVALSDYSRYHIENLEKQQSSLNFHKFTICSKFRSFYLNLV